MKGRNNLIPHKTLASILFFICILKMYLIYFIVNYDSMNNK